VADQGIKKIQTDYLPTKSMNPSVKAQKNILLSATYVYFKKNAKKMNSAPCVLELL